MLDTAEGAIDRLFETYERQYLHSMHTAANAEPAHNINARNVEGVVAATDAVHEGSEHGKLMRLTEQVDAQHVSVGETITANAVVSVAGVEPAAEPSSAILPTNIEIINAVPAEDGFEAAAVAAEPIVTHSELLHAELLLPPVAEHTSASDGAAVSNEVQVSDGNKLEASERVLAPISGALLLEDAQLADLAPIAPLTVRDARVIDQPASANTLFEGSGDDPAESAVVADAAVLAVAKVVDDSDESAESSDNDGPQIIDVVPVAVTNGTTKISHIFVATLNESGESAENDSNTAAETNDTRTRTHATSGRNQSDDDDDEDDTKSSASELLHTVVEAVRLGTDLQDAMHSFRDIDAENASIRQARSRSAAAAAAVALAAAHASLDGDQHPAVTGARSDRPVLLLPALAGYGSVVLTLSVVLMVGVWLVYRRVQDARHVLVIAQV